MAHENPIKFHPRPQNPRNNPRAPRDAAGDRSPQSAEPVSPPRNLDLKRDDKLTITWQDDSVSEYPVAYLRKMSPSADARALRDEMKRNPLTVLSGSPATSDAQPFHVTDAELVGNYAIRLTFSDGHDTGIYSWRYLKSIDPANGPVDPETLLGL